SSDRPAYRIVASSRAIRRRSVTRPPSSASVLVALLAAGPSAFPSRRLGLNFDLQHGIAGLLVGTLVGVTGVGGGSLMTPLLVLIFQTPVTTAVGTDLLYASVTKCFGTAVHQKHGTVDWQIVRRLATGSLPAAALTLFWMHQTGTANIKGGAIIVALAI